MTATKSKVIIKGTKDGLVFLMDDSCSFDDLLSDLREKIEHSHQKILSGPLVRISIKLGKRFCTQEQQDKITDIIRQRGNLVIHTIDSDVISKEEAFSQRLKSGFTVKVQTVRSGQVLEFDGDILLLGDVNPGGTVRSTGSIYVLGNLRGNAHAGTNGDMQAIIASASMNPNQLRIGEIISRPGDEWSEMTGTTEFAYVEDGKMIVGKMNFLPRVRPDHGEIKAQ